MWNDASTGEGAGGGGVSSAWPVPGYQAALSGATKREVPDVSADADPRTGYAIDYKGAWEEFGGTSAAAPTWAALTALAESSRRCAGRSLGLVNDLLYTLPESDFYDVTSGNNSYDGVTGYTAATGYDMASGLGAPDGALLVPALCGAPAGTAVTEPATGAASAAAPSTGTSPPGATPSGTSTPGTTVATPPPTTTTTADPARPTSTAPHPRPAKVAFTGPTRRRDRLGAVVRVVLRARDCDGLRLRYSAHGLPPGLQIDRATGAVTDRRRRAGAFGVSVSAVDTADNASSVVIRWTISGHRSGRSRAARRRSRSK